MNNKLFSDLLERMGMLLEIQGDNPFKIRAYYKAAENIYSLSEDIAKLKDEGRLSEIPGVGEAIRSKIIEWLETGHVKVYDELIKEVPESLLELTQVPSVGPKKAKLFYEQYKIKNVDDLKVAIESGKLKDADKIKEKTLQNILNGIKIVKQGLARMDLGKATSVAKIFVEELKKLPDVKQIEAAGSLRRGSETVRDIDILIDSNNPKKVMDIFVHLPQVRSINAHGETKSSIMTRDNVQVDLRVIEPKSFGAALLYFTGSTNFNVKLRQLAIKKDMKVNEYGVFSIKGTKEKLLASKTEEECLKVLGLPYIPPELREDIGSEDIFDGKPVPKLIELKDLKGELHVHSTYSDGRNTIREMAEAAKSRGYEYIGISDHSAKLKIAGGVSAENLKKKKKEIEALNKGYKNFKIFFGSEVEVDMDGRLDYNDDILKDFDVVIAAIHSHFDLPKDQQTRRIINAIKNKRVHILAHPFGIHIGKREAYDVDFKEICKAAVDYNVCLEINSFPQRLDLNSHNIYFARKHGVRLVINSDSHAVEHLYGLQYGITIARRGWVEPKHVLNTMSVAQIQKALQK